MKEIIAKRIPPQDLNGDCGILLEDGIKLQECIEGDEPKQATLFNVYYDGHHLYFTFKVYDNYINPIRKKYNSPIYEEEVVEIFIAGKRREEYLEFEVSPINTRFCAIITNKPNTARKLRLIRKCIFDSKAVLKDYGYDVIIKSKVEDICNRLGIKDLDICYFNAYRIDRPQASGWELSALTPTLKNTFHCVDSFVRLIMEE